MSWSTVYNAIKARFKEQVEVGYAIKTHYDNSPAPSTSEIGSDPWIRFTIKTGADELVSIGSPTQRFRQTGVATAQILVPLMRGMNKALEIADNVKSVFRAVTVSGVVFRAPGLVNVGRVDEYWQVNVVCPFWTDEIS